MKVACCWSGGKDSCYAYWKAVAQGHDVCYLVNFASTVRPGRNAFHGVRHKLIRMQAEAAGVPLIQRETSWEGYEQSFREVMNQLRSEGIEGVVTGDIDIVEHRTWTENMCGEVGLKALLPLWKLDRRKIIMDFVDEGFESIVVCLRADMLDETWLGRSIDRNFISDLQAYGRNCSVDICGENGEYHTFVMDGPAFHKRISVTLGSKVLSEGYWFQDIAEAKLIKKAV